LRRPFSARRLAAFGIAVVILIFVSTLVTAYVLVSIISVLAGIGTSFVVPSYLRLLGTLLLGIGLGFVGWVFRYRPPNDFFVSTWVTIRKRVKRIGIERTGGRTEPFVPLGPYLYVRNPTYFGGIATLYGTGIATGSVVVLAWAILMTLLFWYVIIPYEEKELQMLFGEAYVKYQLDVPKLFPNGKKYKSDRFAAK